ncbi:MAG TPA: caspase family protein [Terriglobia bacterium]|nr:caspase family protein [Terriglobia bacterium]
MNRNRSQALSLTSFVLTAFSCCLGTLLAQTPAAPQQRGVTPVASQPASEGPHGGFYALVIGIDDYQHVQKLQTPVNDANAIAGVLQSRYGFNVTELRNATRHDILTALDGYRRTLHDNDSLLVYYAGHGHYDKETDKGYWLPADAESDSTADWIIADDITSEARAIPARHVLVISDSCYSGMLTRDVSPTITPLERNVYIGKMLMGKSRQVMSSGGDEPVADGDTRGHPANHSVFANALLQGLNLMEYNQFSADELFTAYIKEQVGGRSDQVPQYNTIRDSGHEDGDFVFFRSQGPGTAFKPDQPKITLVVRPEEVWTDPVRADTVVPAQFVFGGVHFATAPTLPDGVNARARKGDHIDLLCTVSNDGQVRSCAPQQDNNFAELVSASAATWKFKGPILLNEGRKKGGDKKVGVSVPVTVDY